MKRLFIITILALAFMQVNAQHTAGTHLPSGKLSREGASTRNAEFLGWVMGIKNTNILQRQFELLKSIIHPVTSFIF